MLYGLHPTDDGPPAATAMRSATDNRCAGLACGLAALLLAVPLAGWAEELPHEAAPQSAPEPAIAFDGPAIPDPASDGAATDAPVVDDDTQAQAASRLVAGSLAGSLAIARPAPPAASSASGVSTTPQADRYVPRTFSGNVPYRPNDATTVRGHAVGRDGHGVLGVDVTRHLGAGGALSTVLTGSHNPQSNGWLMHLNYELEKQDLSVSIRSRLQSAGFRDMGPDGRRGPLRQRTLAIANVRLGTVGHLSLAGGSQKLGGSDRTDVVAFGLGVPFRRRGTIASTTVVTPGVTGASYLSLSFAYALDGTPAGGVSTRKFVEQIQQNRLTSTMDQARH